ncbi:MAG: DUF3737 family protein [Ruminococcus flavefaciens]|nr:DUF3737 family protein [Ruminococcus flavefaciens]MCM1061938.1 DUF3737 family protein [Eubacterium sp.]
MKFIENKTFDEERALYGEKDLEISYCHFDGPADGESALKESENISADNCFFNLRYPFWHDKGLNISNSEMTELCRAALWYSEDITITNTRMHGIKALRECSGIKISDCDIISPEFSWFSKNIVMENSIVQSEYCMMRSSDINFNNINFKGKYSFQYIENAVFTNCIFDTKDAFWHGKNVTVKDSIIKGEYLAWYSDGLTLINCKISGTQPFCYCRNLKLINCEMIDADLCFEKSEVDAEITTDVISIKNPLSGMITLPAVGEIIMDDENANGIVKIMKKAVC